MLTDNLYTVHLQWLVDLARKGDSEQLAELMQSEGASLLNDPVAAELLWPLLIDAVSGKLAKPRKNTYLVKERRWQVERFVAESVEARMRMSGKQRDNAARTYWTRKLAGAYGTTPEKVAAFLKSSGERRR